MRSASRTIAGLAGPAVASGVLGDPVLAGEPRVEHPVGDVARHLLRADQHAVDFRIVDRREVRPRAGVDVEPGAREEVNRRVLQRAFRNPELDLVGHVVTMRRSVAEWLKHVRSPVWHTLPSPSLVTRTSTVSSSQSTRIRSTCSRLPEVSPFIHSCPRVRLKKVANPVATVRSSASWFMKPTIRTSFDTSSWMTAGISPSSFEKSIKRVS